MFSRTEVFNGSAKGDGIALDENNTIYMCGFYENKSKEGHDAYIAVFDEFGQSTRNITGSASEYDIVYDLTLDTDSNVYITGSYVGSDSQYREFLAKYSNTGGMLLNVMCDQVFEQGKAIKVDSSQNIYLT